MRVTFAAYIYAVREDGRNVYVCQNARSQEHATRNPLLSSALSKLGNKLRKAAETLIREGKVQRLNAWLYDPKCQTRVCKLKLTLRDRTLSLKLLLVCQPAFERFVVYSPAISGVDFEIESLQQLEDRAIEVYSRWAQEQISRGLSTKIVEPSEMWVEPLELELETKVAKKKKADSILAALMGGEKMHGAAELRKVGQCLDESVDDFPRVLGRDELIEEADAMLTRGDRQGVLFVGQRSAGKTAIIQECVRKRMQRYLRKRGSKPQVWWLSPQRIISGMSYLGQWEQRWLSILQEATKRDHILYFDDLVGLFSAGKTRDSNLSAADVLRSYWAENRVRVLAEITAEQLAIFRRRDRALADRFHLIHVPSWSSDDAMPVVLEAANELRQSSFHPEALPLVMRHQEIFAPDKAFPGKAIEMFQAIAKRSENNASRGAFYVVAANQVGSNLNLLTGNLGSQEVIAARLAERLIGQPEAVSALSQVALRFSQHLQAPDRPLGVLLFLGPTGVGKTESAKALTKLLYHRDDDDSFLVRIDMNELKSPLAVEQLVGTFDHPEGRLTSAVRRRPNCVLLLDEIEKAHPDVFDLLLQVIGEGRLTDARGRVADFRSAVIIMTSNLGVGQQNKNLGFETTAAQRTASFVKAAKEFFRPEFVNRIDDIVAFRNLTEEDMEGIVRLQMQEVLARDGFGRREVFVHVADSAIERVIQSGFDPQLGARAVRRKIEREVIGPLGDCLSETSLTSPALVQIRSQKGKQDLDCAVTIFDEVARQVHRPPLKLDPLIKSAERLHEQWKAELQQLREPLREQDRAYEEKFEDMSYYALQEQLVRCEEWIELAKLRKRVEHSAKLSVSESTVAKPRSDSSRDGDVRRRRLLVNQSFQDMRAGLAESENNNLMMKLPELEFRTSFVDCFSMAQCQLHNALSPRTWLIGCPLFTQGVEDSQRNSETTRLQYEIGRITQVLDPTSLIVRLQRCLGHDWQYETASLWLES
ncbi:MAG: AAA family ATPase [Planctomycetota bacterium]